MTELYLIDWIDSKIEIGEVRQDDKHEYATMSSVGYLIYEDQLVLTLAQDYRGDEDTWRTTITIPKISIVNKTKLDRVNNGKM